MPHSRRGAGGDGVVRVKSRDQGRGGKAATVVGGARRDGAGAVWQLLQPPAVAAVRS